MSGESAQAEKKRQKEERASEFSANLAATGLKLGEFAKEAGFTRNVIYNLSIGQAPSSEEQLHRLQNAFERLRRRAETLDHPCFLSRAAPKG